MGSRYTLYNLVTITIDDGVNKNVHDAVVFQIGHFESAQPKHARYEIGILPYENLHIPVGELVDICYGIRGIKNRLVIDGANQIAVEKGDQGYKIWAQNSNFLITHFAQMLLRHEGIAFIHAGAVADGSGNALVLAGAGGVGKTALLGRLVQSYKYRLLGDDIVPITKNGDCLAFPRPFIIKDYHEFVYPEIYKRYKRNQWEKTITEIKTFIRLNAPFRDVLRKMLIKRGVKERVMQSWHAAPYLAAVPIREMFGMDSICDRAPAKRVIFMQRYSGREFRFEPVDREALADKLFSIISFEWAPSYSNALLLSLYGMESLTEYMENVRHLIAASIGHTKNHVLYIPEAAQFSEMAEFFESHCLDL